MSVRGTARSAGDDASRAGDSTALENLARVGLLAYGLVHLLVAWLALQLAWGGGGQSADQSGAMATLAAQPFGRALLWAVAIGLVALAAWQAAEVFRWRADLSASGKQRSTAVQKTTKAVAQAVVYAALAVSALRFALGAGQSSSRQQQQGTAGVFGWPGGRFLVGAAALVLVGIGVQQVYRGVTRTFLRQIDLAAAPPRTTKLITRLGQVGFPARGIALALVGVLLGYAAVTVDPAKASGLDGAMRAVLDAPFGAVLLTLVALGIAAFGAFVLTRARYPERT